MNTSFVNDLVVVTIEDGNRPGNVVDTKGCYQKQN